MDLILIVENLSKNGNSNEAPRSHEVILTGQADEVSH